MSHARDFAFDGPRGTGSSQDRLATWYSQGPSDGLGDRLFMFDNSSAPSLELLRFRPELTASPGFEVALRERVRRLSYFRHDGFARVRAVEYLGDRDGLALVSNFTPGKRLSDVLRAARGPWLAASLIRQLTPMLAALQAQDRGIFHSALNADRIVVTHDGRLVIIEHVLGSALQRLGLPPARLAELGIAVPPSPDTRALRFDSRTDFFQLGLVAVSLLLGRPVAADDYPDKIGELLDQLATTPGGRTGLALARWLERALLIVGPAFESGSDAEAAAQGLPEVDAHHDERLRSLMSAPADAFSREPSEPPQAPRRELPPRIEPRSIFDARPVMSRSEPVSISEVPPRGEQPRLEPVLPSIEIIRPTDVFEMPSTVPERAAVPVVVDMPPVPETPPSPPPPAVTVLTKAPPAPVAEPEEAVRVPEPPRRIAPVPVPEAPATRPAVRRQEPFAPIRPRQPALVSTPVVTTPEPVPSVAPAPAPTPAPANVVPAPSVSDAPAPEPEPAPPAAGLDPNAATPAVDAPPQEPAAKPTRPAAPLRERAQRRKPAPPRRSISAQWFTAIVTGCAIGEALVIVLIVLGQFGAKPADTTASNASTGADQQSPPVAVPDRKSAPSGRPAGRASEPATKPADAATVATIGRQRGDRGTAPSPDRAFASGRSTGFRISSPIVLQVFEGERLLGSTADGIIDAPPGRREVDLVNTSVGYRARQTVYVRPGTIASIGVSLPSGRVSVNASPWAEVLIDGKSVGETPLGNLSVPIGEHEFVFRHPQLGERRQTATVRADGVTRVTADLQR